MKRRHSCEFRNPLINLYLGQINREMPVPKALPSVACAGMTIQPVLGILQTETNYHITQLRRYLITQLPNNLFRPFKYMIPQICFYYSTGLTNAKRADRFIQFWQKIAFCNDSEITTVLCGGSFRSLFG
jgi:predicted GTPase